MIRQFLSVAMVLVLSHSLGHAQAAKTPVLVELFTSEGCSSCPPADRLLASLSALQPVAGAQIIVLEEHVDYWDAQGWHDRFSSPIFTTRQNVYARHFSSDSYTPQMVVEGEAQFVGNDPSKAVAAITRATGKPKFAITLNQPAIDGKRISASVSTAATSLPKGDLYAALVEPAASTLVRSGENGGKRLDHVSIARKLERVGTVKDLGKGPVAFHLTAPDGVDIAALHLVVFAQPDGQGVVQAIADAPVH